MLRRDTTERSVQVPDLAMYDEAIPWPEAVSHEGVGRQPRARSLEVQRQIILDTLQACQGSRKAVAEKLGISPRTLRYKIAKMRENGIAIPA